MEGFENIPVRENGMLDVDASWWNTIRTYLINAFPNYKASSSAFTIANNQSSLADITGLLLDSSTHNFWLIRYRINRSTDSPLSYLEVGTLKVWFDGTSFNYSRTVDFGNALVDGDEEGEYQIGGADTLQIDASTGQAKYLSSNLAGGSYAGAFDWRLIESWAI